MADLPTPDFTFNADAPGACVAGVRPYRVGSYRLDAETVSDRFVVHNYGHGGCGITLSWGCAAKVRDIVSKHLAATPGRSVAVLGAGVMGLTAATLLRDLGLDVAVFADRKPLETTSAKAGGQWAVSVMEYAGKERELGEILRAAYARFKGDIGKGFGVSEQPNYTASRTHNFEIVLKLAPGLIPQPTRLAQLPFAHQHRPGWEYHTLLIEPPIFLARLEADLRARGVTFVTDRSFKTRAEVFALPQPIIVNCTGVGALKLWNDPKVTPIKGQLAMLKPQPALHYLYGLGGYMFPRTDHVVIGGTFEMGVNNETIDKAKCRMLVNHIKSLFGAGPATLLPEWHIQHPDNAAIVNPPMPPAPL